MKIINLCRTAYLTALLLTLGACSSSNSDPVADADAGSQAAPGGLQASDTTVDKPVVVPIDDPLDNPIDDPVSEPIDDPLVDTGNDPVATPASDPVEDPGSDPVEDPAGDITEDPSELTPLAAPGIESENDSEQSEPVDSGSDTAPIPEPQAEPGSDLDRLLIGLTRQASITLLDLNQRISQGQTLSDLEEQCLGSFVEGLGSPLLAIDCGGDNFLATGDIELSASKASFYDTPRCSEAIFDDSSEGCVLQDLTLSVGTTFDIPEGASRPQLVFFGSLLNYAADSSDLVIQNLPSAPTESYLCNVNLETVSLTDSTSTENCNEIVRSVADEIGRLQGL